MKKFILLIILAFLVNIPALAKIIYNPLEKVIPVKDLDFGIHTTKITTEEGTYRIFIFRNFRSGGITAVKIK